MANNPWVYDTIDTYRLNQQRLARGLMVLFGNYDFQQYITVSIASVSAFARKCLTDGL